jgi:flavin-dependent dehydrogenase
LGGWAEETELPLNGSVALSRNALDLALIAAAREAGAHVLQGVRASLGSVDPDRRTLDVSAGDSRREVLARVVVAADGLSSGLMAQAGVPSRPPESNRRPLIGLGQVFPPEIAAYESGIVHMAVGEEGYVGLNRVEDGSLDVAAALRAESLREAGGPHALVVSLLRRAGWPSLPDAFPGGWKGTPELTRRPRRPGARRLLAVGDAAGYVEPFTGEGIFWALAGARALAPLAGQATADWRPEILEAWTRTHRRLLGRAQRYCRALAWALARPTVTRNALRLMNRYPSLANPVVRRVGAPLAALT